MTPEGKVKRKIKDWLKVNMPDHWAISPRGGPFGKAGCPDILICWIGIFIAIEVKADDKAFISDLQIAQLKLITKAGGVAAVVKGYDTSRLNLIKSIALNKFNHDLHN